MKKITGSAIVLLSVMLFVNCNDSATAGKQLTQSTVKPIQQVHRLLLKGA